jgi:ferric-dicitrate binding protein FerR (iron transport regulator)
VSHPADDLIAAWLADDLDTEGVRALEECLRRDPTARDRFARFCQSETVLPQALAIAPVRQGTTGLRRAVRAGSRRMRPRRPVGRFGWVLPLTAAAALVVVVLVIGSDRPAQVPGMQPTAASDGPLELLHAAGAVQASGRPVTHGSIIPRGAVVEVAGGVADLRWRDGSRLHAAVGTRLRIEDDDVAIHLLAGHLDVNAVSRSDRPFGIRAPHATATVMGTRFTLGVRSEVTELSVGEGRVRFASSVGGTVAEVIVGESARADATGLRLGQVGVLGFVPTASAITRVLGPRLIGRGTLHLHGLPADGINLRVDCVPEVKAVRAGMRGVGSPRLEQVRDFFVFGDQKNRATDAWKPRLGTFVVDAQPFSDAEGREPLGPSVVFELTIVP